MQRFITYDASCNFCQGVVRFLKKHDSKKHFVYVPIQSEEGEAIIRKAGLPEKDRNTVVYYTGGRYFLRQQLFSIFSGIHTAYGALPMPV